MTRESDVVRSLVEMADTLVEDYDVVDLLTGAIARPTRGCSTSAAARARSPWTWPAGSPPGR